MSLATNVVRRGGSYYFRTRVPKALVPLLGRSEVWKSLRTTDILDARLRAATQVILTQRLWERLQPDMTMREANQIAKEMLADQRRDYERLRAELVGVFAQPPPAVAQPLDNRAHDTEGPASGLTLGKASRDYMLVLKRAGEVKAKRLQDYQKAFDAFLAWRGDDPDLMQITNAVAGRFQTDLAAYPARGSVRPEYRQLGFRERVALSVEMQEADTLNATTINNKYLGPLRALFDHYRRGGYGEAIPTNPFDGVSAKGSRKAHRENRKRDFTVPEMQSLFDLPLFTGSAGLSHKRLYQRGMERVSDWRYWIMPIGLFAGTRLNEACGLSVSDFREDDGIAYLMVREVLPDQSAKSDKAWRRVPLHQSLLDLGLMEFVERQRRLGHDRLFPELKPDRFGYLSAVPSKFFNDLIARIVDPDPVFPGKLTPHSARHTVVGRMRSADVRIDIATEIVGHEEGSTHAGYGGVDLSTLKQNVDRIEYKGLDLGRMRLPDHLLL